MKFVSKTMLSTAMIGLISGHVLAAEKIGDVEISGSMAVVSDYVWRGLSQTYKKPAVQGGLEMGHSSGLYLGTWGSNVKFTSNGAPSDGANLELDYYGGFRYEYSKGNSIDIGGYRYAYPGTSKPYDFTEVYLKGNYSFLTAGYYYSNKFFNDTGKGHYFTIGANYVLPYEVTLSANVGRSEFKKEGILDYTDWNVGLSKDFAGLSFALTYTDTNVKSENDLDGLGKARVVLGVSKKF